MPGLVSVVTSLTPDMVEVQSADPGQIKVKIDALLIHLAGDDREQQLTILADVAKKLLNAHDAIAAQERLFPAETS